MHNLDVYVAHTERPLGQSSWRYGPLGYRWLAQSLIIIYLLANGLAFHQLKPKHKIKMKKAKELLYWSIHATGFSSWFKLQKSLQKISKNSTIALDVKSRISFNAIGLLWAFRVCSLSVCTANSLSFKICMVMVMNFIERNIMEMSKVFKIREIGSKKLDLQLII